MPLKTTVIGSYPKPDYLKTPDWFRLGSSYKATLLDEFKSSMDVQELQALEKKAVKEVLDKQTELGIDYITDGEITRGNYINHFLRKVKGFDFEDLTLKTYRNGACTTYVPTIRSSVTPVLDEPWVLDEWRETQSMTSTPVKVTIPGPLTIINSTQNSFYDDVKELSIDLVNCINKEVVALAEAGCKYIQIDEPLLVREPENALNYAIDHLKLCFKGVGSDVIKGIHLCCGYPEHLDHEDYPKADPDAYLMTAEKLDASGFDVISIEDGHRYNDLNLFSKFKNSTIIMGCVAIAKSQIETEEQIRTRVKKVLEYIPAERLWLAPDCGLAYLPTDILEQKVKNMVAVAKSLP